MVINGPLLRVVYFLLVVCSRRTLTDASDRIRRGHCPVSMEAAGVLFSNIFTVTLCIGRGVVASVLVVGLSRFVRECSCNTCVSPATQPHGNCWNAHNYFYFGIFTNLHRQKLNSPSLATRFNILRLGR